MDGSKDTSKDGSKSIWVPVEELVPGHMYYITSTTISTPIPITSPSHLPIPDCLITNRFNELHPQRNHVVGIFACKTGVTEYMFTHVSSTALSPSFPTFIIPDTTLFTQVFAIPCYPCIGQSGKGRTIFRFAKISFRMYGSRHVYKDSGYAMALQPTKIWYSRWRTQFSQYRRSRSALK